MAIVLVFLAIAATVLFILGTIFIASLLFGGLLLYGRRTRIFVPIFFSIIPATIIGSLAGGVIVGYLAIQANENLVFLGPLGGVIVGGLIGLFLGLVSAIFWWWRISSTTKTTNSAPR